MDEKWNFNDLKTVKEIENKKEDDIFISWLEEVTLLDGIYNCKLHGKRQKKYKTMVIVATEMANIDFIKQYHDTVFIFTFGKKAYWQRLINDDCDVIIYPIPTSITKKKDDGLMAYLLHCCLEFIVNIDNINIFIKAYCYYKGINDVLQKKGIDTDFIQMDSHTNKVISFIKNNGIATMDLKELHSIIHTICPNSNTEIIVNSLIDCGYCGYKNNEQLNVLKELL